MPIGGGTDHVLSARPNVVEHERHRDQEVTTAHHHKEGGMEKTQAIWNTRVAYNKADGSTERTTVDPRTGEVNVRLDPGGFSNWMLKTEGRSFIYWSFSATPPAYIRGKRNLSQETWLKMIKEDLKKFQPTIVFAPKSNITAITFLDEEGNPVPWMDFRNFGFRMSEKMAKRLTFLTWSSYYHATYNTTRVVEGYTPHNPGSLTIKISDPDDPVLYDGQSFIRPSVMQAIVDAADGCIREYDVARANELWQENANHKTFSVRGILPVSVAGGKMLKGDLVAAASDDDLPADIVTTMDNLKDEVFSKTEKAYFIFNPVHQKDGDVRTNRQNLSIFYEFLLKGHIEDAFVKKIDENVDMLMEGELPNFVRKTRMEDDSLANQQQKFLLWEKLGLGVRDSLHLYQMLVGQVYQMMEPPGVKNDERKFPVPYAELRSLRNYQALHDLGYRHKRPARGEAFVHEIGLVLNDEDYKVIMPILGGGDADDHAEIHYRIANDDDPRFGIKAGEMIMILIRNPIGIVSNGEKLAAEYYIVKASPEERRRVERHWGQVPRIDLIQRPNVVDEIQLTPYFSDETVEELMVRDDLPETYTKNEAWSQIQSGFRANIAYGSHANLCMIFMQHGIPFRYFTAEENFVDIAQQIRTSAGIDFIERANAYHAEELVKSGVAIEPVNFDRVEGLLEQVESEEDWSLNLREGLFADLASFHKGQVERFVSVMKADIISLMGELKARFQYKPQGASRVLQINAEIQNEMVVLENGEMTPRFPGKKSFTDWSTIGDELTDRIKQEFPSTYALHEGIYHAMAELYSKARLSANYRNQRSGIGRLVQNSDAPLMNGRMLRASAWVMKSVIAHHHQQQQQ